ncbi:MAG: hypothetical protein ACOCSK_03195 [Rhodothermales bacterium]
MSDKTGKTNRMPTAWVVWVFIVLYAAMLALQAYLDFQMPIDGATWALLFVVGGYVGMDEFASFVASKKLPKGMKYTGSYRKLMYIVIAMFALVLLAIIVQANAPEYELPLDRLAMAAGLVSGLFAGGNKAANAAEQEEGS